MSHTGNPLDPYFAGSNARAAFAAVGGAQYNGVPVPLENLGGPGTYATHWRYWLMLPELMTSAAVRGRPMPLSAITIGAMQDIGYTTNPAAADAYRVFGFQPLSIADISASRVLGDRLLRPRGEIDRTGRVRYYQR